MSPRRRRRLAVATGLVAVLPLAAAGIARYSRSSAEQALVAEQERAAQLQLRREQLATQAPPPPAPPLAWRLHATADVAATMQQLQTLCDAAGVQVDTLQGMTGRQPGKQPLQLAGRGSPTAITRLLVAIEGCDELLVVESGRCTPGDAGSIAFDFGVALYHQEVRR
jgi:hypothetical protein